MQQSRFEYLARHFRAGKHFFSGVAYGRIGRRESDGQLFFFTLVQYDGDQAIGFYLRRGDKRKIDVHDFLFSIAVEAETRNSERSTYAPETLFDMYFVVPSETARVEAHTNPKGDGQECSYH